MTDGLTVLLFYDVHTDIGATLNLLHACVLFVDVEPYNAKILLGLLVHILCISCVVILAIQSISSGSILVFLKYTGITPQVQWIKISTTIISEMTAATVAAK